MPRYVVKGGGNGNVQCGTKVQGDKNKGKMDDTMFTRTVFGAVEMKIFLYNFVFVSKMTILGSKMAVLGQKWPLVENVDKN